MPVRKHNDKAPSETLNERAGRTDTRIMPETPRDQAPENILVHGDNLAAYAQFSNQLRRRARLAFMDPPYNRKRNFEQYADSEDSAKWLADIETRIDICRDTLNDEGSMWITIDDTESHYLKVTCDKVFGRENFIANIIWQKKYTVANDVRHFSKTHDHILVYAKNAKIWRPHRRDRTVQMDARYANPDQDPHGPWKSTPLHAKSGAGKNQSPYIFQNGVSWSPPPGTYFRYATSTLAQLEADGAIAFGKPGNVPRRKTYLHDVPSGPPYNTIWLRDEVGDNHEAKRENAGHENPFDTPKPLRLMRRIIEISTDPGDLVVDLYAGSGTTAVAAIQTGRRFFVVESGNHARTHALPRIREYEREKNSPPSQFVVV